MFYYALTLVKTRGKRTLKAYQDYIDKLDCEKLSISYELDKGLHVHLTLVSQCKITLKDVMLHKYGWSVRFNKLNDPGDLGRWVIYCNKQLYAYHHLHLEDEEERNAAPHEVRATPNLICPEVSTAKSTSSLDEDTLPTKYTYPRFDIRKIVTKAISDSEKYLDESKRI